MTGNLLRMRTAELDYELDQELIATSPAEPRDAARMLVVFRDEQRLEHRHVRDLAEYLAPEDGLVLNNTQVAPARVILERVDTGGRFEGLLLEDQTSDDGQLEAYVRGAKRLPPGARLALRDEAGGIVGTFEVGARVDDRVRLRELEGPGARAMLDAAGKAPLPPYILGARRARGEADTPELDRHDRDRYATVFSRECEHRSVAAPTAGLHFTPALLDRLLQRGLTLAEIELQVGAGTFQPVVTDTLEGHRMHSERYAVGADALTAISTVRGRGGRVLAVGTTCCRTLESLPDPLPSTAVSGQTTLLIQPGHRFRHVDALLTNFHLPRSTLLALLAAFMGLERTRAVYLEAVQERYRFYSYGDAMLVL